MKDFIKDIERFNFWKNIPKDLGLERKDYTDKIFKYTNSNLIKVIVGQRRVGKSYLLRQILAKLIKNGVPAKNTLYINKEFSDFDFLNTHADLNEFFKAYKAKFKPKGKLYIFIDEIQNISSWEKFVNSLSQDFTQESELFISGSNSKMLSGELATLLSGRYVNFEVFPFSFTEYTKITNKGNNRQAYLEYMQEGAYPELFKLSDPESKRHYVSSIKDTVLLRDIIQRFRIKDPKLLEDIFVFLINNASNLISIPNIVKYFESHNRKTTYETVSSYISHISDAFLLHKVERYNIKGKETLLSNCKYYANDLSFKNYLYSGTGYGIGYMLENLVYLELKRHGFDVYVGTLPNKEIDFIAKKNDKTIYLQTTYLLNDQTTIQREYSSLEAIKDNYPKYVVSLDELPLASREGIKHIQAWNLKEIF